MIESKQFQDTIHRFIALYGDRTEGIGDEIHAGLAWIDRTKFVLIGGGDTTPLQPPGWRRISRLLDLAQQLSRPLLLWDVPFQTDITSPTTTLLHRSAAQNSQLQLLKLSVPIIGVFDALALAPNLVPIDALALAPNLVPIDAAVLIQPGETDPQQETSPIIVKAADNPSGLKSDILELLSRLSALPVERLVDQRLNSIRQAVGGGY